MASAALAGHCLLTCASDCRGRIKHKMDHLACFIPAMLALGVQQGAVQGIKAEQYLALAADLTYTCMKMYSLQPTGELLGQSLREALLLSRCCAERS